MMKMKKKLIAAAVGAAITGTVSTANAVVNNPDGLGGALIYPYYTVRAGNDTLISVVNTTADVKAVKVRILEGKNTREVLDFNLFLSPFDVWTASISMSQNGALLRTADNSCTTPAIPGAGVEFRNFGYTGDRDDAAEDSLDRTREGHLEIIEMGVLTGSFADDATHTATGEPDDCDALASVTSADIDAPTGGLFGGALIVNVAEGIDASYNALALDGFSNQVVFTPPGDLTPSLAEAFPPVSTVFSAGQAVESNWGFGTADPVSAVLMHNTLMNEFTVQDDIAATTDWVITFPTKRFFVDPAIIGEDQPALAPFTSVFDSALGACEDVGLQLWNREEQTAGTEIDFSPLPPVGRNALCWETNVITFNNSDVLGSALSLNINTGFQNGWGRISFTNPDNVLIDEDGDRYSGLPAIGFAVQKFVNGDVGGLLSNYSNLFNHRATRSITEGQ